MAKQYRSIADLYHLYGLAPFSTNTATPRQQALGGLGLAQALRTSTPAANSLSWLARSYAQQRAANKSGHDAMLGRLLLQQQALLMHDIKADLPSYPTKPELIYWESTGKGHVPDLTAKYLNGRGVVFEVETQYTIGIEHTREQCRLFSAFARRFNQWFVLVVPTDQQVRAAMQLRAWGIVGTVQGI